MKRITWVKCSECPGGLHAPYVTARLNFDGKTSAKIQFLIDSGASRSLVPRHYVADLFDLNSAPAEAPSELRDASGGRIKGLDIDFDVSIVNAPTLPVTHERIFMGRDIRFAVLGMTWFEQIGVHFQNFPLSPRGRQFALYPCPRPGK